MTERTGPRRRRRPHAASTARILVAGMSASATLLLTAAFTARANEPATGAARGYDPAAGTTVPTADGWDRSGATPSPGAQQAVAVAVAAPDTETQAS